jgi:hypothetical protein
MILSFIEIENLRTEHQNDVSLQGSSLEMELRETLTDTGNVKSPVEQNPDQSRITTGIGNTGGISKENSGEIETNRSEDLFELKYLRYREKFEKERFARELLTGKE